MLSHTSINIATRIMNVLEDYSLLNRITTFTIDNDSSNDRAIEILHPSVSGCHDSLLHQR